MDIQSHQFIAFFEPEQATQLCTLASIETFSEGQIIFHEGEVPDFLYLVLEGLVLFRKETVNNHYQIVAQAQPNDFFGEFGILDGQPRSAEAVVKDGATLAKIPRNGLMEILNDTDSGVVLKLFRYVIQRLRVTTEQYVKQVAHKEKMVLMGEMVNTIIHDLKSPLSSIHLSSGMLSELHQDEESLEWCDLIQTQATRMMMMAEELLEFSRGGASLRRQPLNLFESLKQFRKLNDIYLHQENIEFTLSCPQGVYVYADENKLMRVFQNLVGNAVESLKTKMPQSLGKVQFSVQEKSHWVEITIQDNGPGIPESIRENFFEPFVTYGKERGTGLGTAIAKSIIDAHEGRIWFETSHELGTTFFIDLPVLKPENKR
ncbi:ATP-binding protein [Spirulina sp. CS-785/01]|uniref:ATP-binding protein n=1 Tax=Spirulina sp. CS-785/01 TaxID=3021716 RepID=UPI00232CA333|nr:ATP-binding protein [Spirulina sp. CS-785/01]MDB9312990.1 ATP-binding protein [Spirulina sp. CS-785/01]